MHLIYNLANSRFLFLGAKVNVAPQPVEVALDIVNLLAQVVDVRAPELPLLRRAARDPVRGVIVSVLYLPHI